MHAIWKRFVGVPRFAKTRVRCWRKRISSPHFEYAARATPNDVEVVDRAYAIQTLNPRGEYLSRHGADDKDVVMR